MWKNYKEVCTNMNLSKSLYTKGIQCPKALWLKKYKPNVLTPPDEASLALS